MTRTLLDILFIIIIFLYVVAIYLCQKKIKRGYFFYPKKEEGIEYNLL